MIHTDFIIINTSLVMSSIIKILFRKFDVFFNKN